MFVYIDGSEGLAWLAWGRSTSWCHSLPDRTYAKKNICRIKSLRALLSRVPEQVKFMANSDIRLTNERPKRPYYLGLAFKSVTLLWCCNANSPFWLGDRVPAFSTTCMASWSRTYLVSIDVPLQTYKVLMMLFPFAVVLALPSLRWSAVIARVSTGDLCLLVTGGQIGFQLLRLCSLHKILLVHSFAQMYVSVS